MIDEEVNKKEDCNLDTDQNSNESRDVISEVDIDEHRSEVETTEDDLLVEDGSQNEENDIVGRSTDLISEGEHQGELKKTKKAPKRSNFILNVSMFIFILMVAGVVAYNEFRLSNNFKIIDSKFNKYSSKIEPIFSEQKKINGVLAALAINIQQINSNKKPENEEISKNMVMLKNELVLMGKKNEEVLKTISILKNELVRMGKKMEDMSNVIVALENRSDSVALNLTADPTDGNIVSPSPQTLLPNIDSNNEKTGSQLPQILLTKLENIESLVDSKISTFMAEEKEKEEIERSLKLYKKKEISNEFNKVVVLTVENVVHKVISLSKHLYTYLYNKLQESDVLSKIKIFD